MEEHEQRTYSEGKKNKKQWFLCQEMAFASFPDSGLSCSYLVLHVAVLDYEHGILCHHLLYSYGKPHSDFNYSSSD